MIVIWAAVCVYTADALAGLGKLIVDRPRPFEVGEGTEPLLHGIIGSSMPSGHAATSFAGAVILTYLLPRAAPYVFVLAVAISFSRIYVGVHYPSDVLAGAALGAFVALTALGAFRLRRRISGVPRRSEEAPPAG
jgi:membrane-associated phospholipid phosphatase